MLILCPKKKRGRRQARKLSPRAVLQGDLQGRTSRVRSAFCRNGYHEHRKSVAHSHTQPNHDGVIPILAAFTRRARDLACSIIGHIFIRARQRPPDRKTIRVLLARSLRRLKTAAVRNDAVGNGDAPSSPHEFLSNIPQPRTSKEDICQSACFRSY